MTETKWTPGPWAMPDVEIGIISKFISPGRWDGMIATADCGNYARSRSEGLANARLMAASPDLYAATDWVDKIKGFTFSKGELKWPAPESIPIESPTTLFDLSNKRCDEMVFDIPLKGKEIRALIDARRKARGE